MQALLARGADVALFDLFIPSEMSLADDTGNLITRTRLRQDAVRACRERLLLSSSDAHAWQVYAWLADLARRLGEPLVADANERLATNGTSRVLSEAGR